MFVAAPLTPTSLHLLNSQALAHRKPGQLIVTVGRGAVVGEEAIADALDAGRLAGCAADMFAFDDWALPEQPHAGPERPRTAPPARC